MTEYGEFSMTHKFFAWWILFPSLLFNKRMRWSRVTDAAFSCSRKHFPSSSIHALTSPTSHRQHVYENENEKKKRRKHYLFFCLIKFSSAVSVFPVVVVFFTFRRYCRATTIISTWMRTLWSFFSSPYGDNADDMHVVISTDFLDNVQVVFSTFCSMISYRSVGFHS